LPAPFDPMIAANFPVGTSKLTWLIAQIAP